MTSSPHDLATLRLLQLADSSFPTGGFAFSNGLEGLADLGLLPDAAAIEAAIGVQVEEGLAGVDGPAVLLAHAFASAGDLPALVELDALLTALRPVAAFHAASVRTGRRFLESAADVVAGETLAAYRAAARAGDAEAHHAVAFGVAAAAIGVPARSAALAFGSIALHGQTAAAVRLGLIGQRAAQGIIARTQPLLLRALDAAADRPLTELGGYQPLLELAGLLQPSLETRLFAS